jgi:polyphosphate kinase
VRLNVRGVCCLRPGLPQISDNVEVVSIVDRFLEHARVFYFRNGDHEEVYLSSADLMGRNLDKRLELFFPVTDPRLRRRLTDILQTFFEDNTNAWRLSADGTYSRRSPEGRPVRAQEAFWRAALAAVGASDSESVGFRPLTKP